MAIPNLIEMHCVSVMRGDKIALRDFSLTIGAGEHVAILGPNGCGKSTLIKTITRECYPLYREGSRISIFGSESWNIFDLRPLLGIVSNDLMTLSTREVSGRELVLSGFFSSIELMPYHEVTEAMRKKAAGVMRQLEISHLANRALNEMSSGEARRVLIARALVHDPRALLFDEPSNSLDVAAQQELRALMRSLARSGIGMILVTHHLADIIPEIERVILLKDGAIAGDGPKQEILNAATLSELFEVQVDLAQRDGYYHLW